MKVNITAIKRAERMVIGHSDYISKHAHDGGALVCKKETA